MSNFAVWAFQSDYEKSWAGLVHCYSVAVPFFRWMLAGDIFYLAVIFGCARWPECRWCGSIASCKPSP